MSRFVAWGALLLCSCLGGLLAYSDSRARTIEADLKEAKTALEAAKFAAVSECGTVYGVFSLAWDCPPLIGSRLPDAVKPLACAPRIAAYRSASLGPVLQKVSAFQPGTAVLVLEEKGDREKALPLTWAPVIGR